MSNSPMMGSDSDRQMADFKSKTAEELAVIKSRLVWLLMPSFFMLLAILGLSVFTWMSVNEIQQQMKGTNQSITDLNKAIKPRPIGVAPEPIPEPTPEKAP